MLLCYNNKQKGQKGKQLLPYMSHASLVPPRGLHVQFHIRKGNARLIICGVTRLLMAIYRPGVHSQKHSKLDAMIRWRWISKTRRRSRVEGQLSRHSTFHVSTCRGRARRRRGTSDDRAAVAVSRAGRGGSRGSHMRKAMRAAEQGAHRMDAQLLASRCRGEACMQVSGHGARCSASSEMGKGEHETRR
jgi:hypothetical protein